MVSFEFSFLCDESNFLLFMIFVGWQPRWFVLDNGILSYYDSQDDVCKGSKGSIKMAVCEIKGEWIYGIRGIWS